MKEWHVTLKNNLFQIASIGLNTGKHFVHPLRPAARYAIFKAQRGKPQAATRK